MKEAANNIYQIAIAIAVLVATLLGLDYYIGVKVDSAVNNPGTIREIASEVRPSLVFNIEGSVVYDLGGMGKLIEAPQIEKTKERIVGSQPAQYSIMVSPQKALKIAPILECINGLYNITFKRGQGNKWVYIVEEIETITTGRSEFSDESLFRMEIIN